MPQPRTSEVSALLLHASYTDGLSYIDDWLDAFTKHPRIDATVVNVMADGYEDGLGRQLHDADLVVVLHSALGDTVHHIGQSLEALVGRHCPLVVFVGNEVNLPGVRLRDKISWIADANADIVATQLLREAGNYLYTARTGAKVIAVPHALNPAAFTPGPPHPQRSRDIGVRSAKYGALLGDDDRVRLFDAFETSSFDPPLAVDISTTERLNRSQWAAFLADSRATIATEAGSFYLDPDDLLMDRIRADLLSGGPAISEESETAYRLRRLLPQRARRALLPLVRRVVKLEKELLQEITIEQARADYFAHAEVAPVYSKAVSSRHFDAIGTQTCQILMEGRYNDILQPGVHYIPVRRDLADLDEAVARFHDESARDAMVKRAYEFVMDAHTHRHRVDEVLGAVEAL